MNNSQTDSQIVQCLSAIKAFNFIAGNLDKPVDYNLEYNMLKEEVLEYLEASIEGNEVKQKDALADIMIVLWGTVVKHGWENSFFKVLQEVCKSNLTKFCETADEANETVQKYLSEGINTHMEFNEQYQVYVIKRNDGKIMKSINFHLPQI
jgi:hypothetical protein